MHIHIEPVNEKNLTDILALEILPEQAGFIESVKDCLYEAAKVRCWRPVGIYDDKKLIGFSMYGFFWQYLPLGRVWLDRLLIDKKYQGCGYGTQVVPVMIKRLRNEYHRKTIYLSVIDENAAAVHLYEKYGFRFTGELDVHGEKVMVLR